MSQQTRRMYRILFSKIATENKANSGLPGIYLIPKQKKYLETYLKSS